MDQNESITARFLDDKDFRGAVSRYLMKQAFEQIRGAALGVQVPRRGQNQERPRLRLGDGQRHLGGVLRARCCGMRRVMEGSKGPHGQGRRPGESPLTRARRGFAIKMARYFSCVLHYTRPTSQIVARDLAA